MKTLIKYLMLALSIIQIDAFAIGAPKIINTHRPFSNQEKKQQFQNRGSLWPWTGLVLTTGIGAGLFHYFWTSRTSFNRQQMSYYKARQSIIKTADMTPIKAPLDASGKKDTNDIGKKTNLAKVPDIVQTVGTGMKWVGWGSAAIPLIASTTHDNRSLIPAALISAGIGATGWGLATQTLSHRITDR